MSYQPKTLYLTHYSAITPTARIIAGLHEQIDDYVMLTQKAADDGEQFADSLTNELSNYLIRRCMNEVSGIDEATAKHWIDLDATLNAQGLVFWWQNRR